MVFWVTASDQFFSARLNAREGIIMLSFAVTAYNEMTEPQQHGRRLLKSIEAAVAHPAIDEVVVVNDGPDGADELAALLDGLPKVEYFRNESRMGVFCNKIEAVARCTGDWVITCDSDNIMGYDYIAQVAGARGSQCVWHAASFAKPQFDYRGLCGSWNIHSIADRFFDTPIAACAINTGNQTVHRSAFMDVFEKFRGVRRFDLMLPNYMRLPEEERQSEDWHLAYGACDSILINVEWFKNCAGGVGILCIHKGLEYDHAVHIDKSGSNYDRAPAQKEELAAVLRKHLAEGTLWEVE